MKSEQENTILSYNLYGQLINNLINKYINQKSQMQHMEIWKRGASFAGKLQSAAMENQSRCYLVFMSTENHYTNHY